MDANSFPQGAQHNPFIPARIAQQHQLPRVTPNQELAFANRILRQWLQSGADISFSYVRMQDAYEVLPSLPVRAIAESVVTNFSQRQDFTRYHPYFQRANVALTQFEDWNGTPLQMVSSRRQWHAADQLDARFALSLDIAWAFAKSANPANFLMHWSAALYCTVSCNGWEYVRYA